MRDFLIRWLFIALLFGVGMAILAPAGLASIERPLSPVELALLFTGGALWFATAMSAHFECLAIWVKAPNGRRLWGRLPDGAASSLAACVVMLTVALAVLVALPEHLIAWANALVAAVCLLHHLSARRRSIGTRAG